MDVRHYEAFELKDAIKMIKTDLGKDAVVLSTKEKNVYSSDLGKNCRMFEVIAAANVSDSRKVVNASLGSQLPKVTFPLAANQNEVTVVKKSNLSTSLNHKISHTVPKDILMPVSAPQKQVQLGTIPQNISHEMTEEVIKVREEITKIRREIEGLPQVDWVRQIQEVKLLLHNMMKEKFKSDAENLSSHILDIGVKLRVAGVSESIISDLTTHLGTLNPSQDGLPMSFEKEKEFYLKHTIQQLFRLIHISPSLKPQGARKKFVCLVGPTGVGKTTTIAKLAARMKISDHSDVNLISMDNFRVAGSDQLRSFAKILEVPFHNAGDKNDLMQIISKQNKSKNEIVFIDTPGVTFHSTENKDFLVGIQNIPLPIEFHLVVSATMKQRDLEETLRYFHFLTLQSVVFTKLDESWAFGEILNTSAQGQVPLSYFATGQKIPEDLEAASKERIVERILKL